MVGPSVWTCFADSATLAAVSCLCTRVCTRVSPDAQMISEKTPREAESAPQGSRAQEEAGQS